MTIDQLHETIQKIVVTLSASEITEALRTALEAQLKVPAQEESLKEAAKRISILEQRLAAAMAREEKQKKETETREEKLKEEITKAQQAHSVTRADLNTAQKELEMTRRRIATMREHPDVRRAERHRLAAQLTEIKRQHDALAEPESPTVEGQKES